MLMEAYGCLWIAMEAYGCVCGWQLIGIIVYGGLYVFVDKLSTNRY